MPLINSSGSAIQKGIARQLDRQATRYQALLGKVDVLRADLSLNWRQWLVLFGTGALVIGIEIHNHAHMWQEHGSGQTIWTDNELVWEIVIYGILIPIVVGVFLGHLGRTATERDKLAKELALRRELVSQIYKAQNWHELVELVVASPGKLFAVDRAWLLAHPSAEEEFELIASWERLGSGLLPISAPVSPVVCTQCMTSMSLKVNRILTCHSPGCEGGNLRCTRHCLWLSTDGMRKAALLFDVPVEHALPQAQMKVLDELGVEMSLAMEKAYLQHLEQQQVDVAQNERLRMARDLHDTLGQNVSYLRLQLVRLSTSQLVSDGAVFQEVLAKMLVVADEAYEQVRNTLDELRRTEHRELEESIQLLAAQAGERGGFVVQVRSHGQVTELSPRQNRQIIYILREILNNVEKHAVAQSVDISLQWRKSELKMTVCDDGIGFCPEEPLREDAYGLAIMSERARKINADLVIQSTRGGDTEITLSLPLPLGTPPTIGGV